MSKTKVAVTLESTLLDELDDLVLGLLAKKPSARVGYADAVSPDAALVGLAQLKGEGRQERVREVAVSLMRLVLVSSGAVACDGSSTMRI